MVVLVHNCFLLSLVFSMLLSFTLGHSCVHHLKVSFDESQILNMFFQLNSSLLKELTAPMATVDNEGMMDHFQIALQLLKSDSKKFKYDQMVLPISANMLNDSVQLCKNEVDINVWFNLLSPSVLELKDQNGVSMHDYLISISNINTTITMNEKTFSDNNYHFQIVIHDVKMELNSETVRKNSIINKSNSNSWTLNILGEIQVEAVQNIDSQFANIHGDFINSYNNTPPLFVCLHHVLNDIHSNTNNVYVIENDNNILMNDSNRFVYDDLYDNYQTHMRYANGLDITYSMLYANGVSSKCYELNEMSLSLNITLITDTRLHYLHIWLQTSLTDGKVINSDEYLLLDLEVPIVTIPYASHPVLSRKLKQRLVQSEHKPLQVSPKQVLQELIPTQTLPTIPLSSILINNIIIKAYNNDNSLTILMKQPVLVVHFYWNKYDCILTVDYVSTSPILCLVTRKLFHYEIDAAYVTKQMNGIGVPLNKHFIHSYIHNYCTSEGLNKRECVDIFVKVYQYLYKLLLLHKLFIPQSRIPFQLPTVSLSAEYSSAIFFKYYESYSNAYIQVLPTAKDPLVFIHVDKTAGSNIRE